MASTGIQQPEKPINNTSAVTHEIQLQEKIVEPQIANKEQPVNNANIQQIGLEVLGEIEEIGKDLNSNKPGKYWEIGAHVSYSLSQIILGINIVLIGSANQSEQNTSQSMLYGFLTGSGMALNQISRFLKSKADKLNNALPASQGKA